ncbi:class I SAM-dependent DNA methyltransferase [Arthrobacter sp. ZGTC412]|uniref:class I SAM-dependent DNA methyltransferase n=1 Tax=Arthrobacter sp. ZGTC412 TaxID=2058900 RepID=UPI000CE2BF64|nr:class I SAM-dependent methyltransferase [Arthrobacter sp. ZGTC412]
MTDAEVEAVYSKRAAEYIARFGSINSAHQADRTLIGDWAAPIVGPVLDVGCGPGQWTKFLADQGAAVEGIDVVQSFIEHAKARFPGIPFRVASLNSLGVPKAYASGILAWYSLIHFRPDEVVPALQELALRLVPGGALLIGMFEGEEVEKFRHAVAPAYSWPVGEFTKMLAAAGFETVAIERRTDPGHWPHAAISARLAAGPPRPNTDREMVMSAPLHKLAP